LQFAIVYSERWVDGKWQEAKPEPPRVKYFGRLAVLAPRKRKPIVLRGDGIVVAQDIERRFLRPYRPK
jgi:hypothetical protein